MTEDRFDELLAQSAPARPNRGGDLDGAWRLMVRDARDDVGLERPRRRMNAFVTAAAAIVLVIGGGGVAVAAGLVSWPVGFEDPDAALEFVLPSGRACEIRLVVHDIGDVGEQSADDAIH